MEKDKQKILVTGATGFVGSAVIDELKNYSEYKINGLTGKRKVSEIVDQYILKNFFQCDIGDFGTFPETEELKSTDVLVHTAGLAHQFGSVKREDFWRVNVQGTENICKLAQNIGVLHFILISSVSVYGNYAETEINETFNCQPSGFYAESKLESERRAIEFCEKNGIQLTILRLATVIGEGDHGNTARLITAINKKRFIWIGSGQNKKSLIYKNDVAKAVIQTIHKKGKAGTEIFNLTAEAVSMKEIVEAISQNLGQIVPAIRLPENLLQGVFRVNKTALSFAYLKNLEKTVQKWLSDDIFSGNKFYERFHFRPRTSIPEALARQVEFYLNQKGKTHKKGYRV